MESPPSTHRYRLADTITPFTTPNFFNNVDDIHSQWMFLLLGTAFSACTWAYIESHKRQPQSHQQLESEYEPLRYTTEEIALNKGIGSTEKISSTEKDAAKLVLRPKPNCPFLSFCSNIEKDVEQKSLLFMAMVLTLLSIIWLGVHLISSPSAALRVFQVYQPVPISGNICAKDVVLVQRVFGFSYGHPFIGNYEPPQCEFDSVQINLTVTSQGRQFDRLAIMYLGDIEIFRTSTAEPTANGIVWTYIKDMSHYNALWQEPQKVIFDLGNLINDIYTGPFNVTVTAAFSLQGIVKTADIILPISAQNSAHDSPSAFTVPPQNAKVLQRVHPKTSRAVVSISACGQSTEEFWWSNVFSSDTQTFADTAGELYGHSPFREIQLYIDGILAGVVWPFPIIFTGGVVPGFWRPIVGIDAFDLRQPEIDISPFLSLLTDGEYHSFEIKIVGLNVSADGIATLSDKIGSYWVVTGTIFLYLNNDDAEVTPLIDTAQSREPEVEAPAPKFNIRRQLIKNPAGRNETLNYGVRAIRTLAVKSPKFSWTQNLSVSNRGLLYQEGRWQENNQYTYTISRIEAQEILGDTQSEYFLSVRTEYDNTDEGFNIDATIRRGLWINTTGMPGVSTYSLTSGPLALETEQQGRATYHSPASNRNSTSSGETTDVFRSNAGGESYQRTVKAINGSVILDTDTSSPEVIDLNAYGEPFW